METYRMKGIYGEGDVYVLKTIEDWDEYEKLCRERNSDFLQYNPNFFSLKEDFEKYIGKVWQDKEQLRYTYNDEPVYVEYKVIAIEDNNPMMDWYWIVQNVDDDRDVKSILANSYDLENGIKNLNKVGTGT